eukprot:scaffold16904_cov101-Isochrysis_galbana.AAC.7
MSMSKLEQYRKSAHCTIMHIIHAIGLQRAADEKCPRSSSPPPALTPSCQRFNFRPPCATP